MTTTLCRTPVRASSLASKHALVAEKAEGHHTDLVSILDSVHRRDRWRDGQDNGEERRAEQRDPRLGGHDEPRFEIAALGERRKSVIGEPR